MDGYDTRRHTWHVLIYFDQIHTRQTNNSANGLMRSARMYFINVNKNAPRIIHIHVKSALMIFIIAGYP